jgi:hypothetical protein
VSSGEQFKNDLRQGLAPARIDHPFGRQSGSPLVFYGVVGAVEQGVDARRDGLFRAFAERPAQPAAKRRDGARQRARQRRAGGAAGTPADQAGRRLAEESGDLLDQDDLPGGADNHEVDIVDHGMRPAQVGPVNAVVNRHRVGQRFGQLAQGVKLALQGQRTALRGACRIGRQRLPAMGMNACHTEPPVGLRKRKKDRRQLATNFRPRHFWSNRPHQFEPPGRN